MEQYPKHNEEFNLLEINICMLIKNEKYFEPILRPTLTDDMYTKKNTLLLKHQIRSLVTNMKSRRR